MIDLHTHTIASDGTLSLEELLNAAKKAGLKAIAITDHDTVESALQIESLVPSAKTSKPETARPETGNQIELIPGIELTVYDHPLGYVDIHVLGLFIDPKNKTLNSKLKTLETERIDQKKATVSRLRELGYDITFDEVRAKARGSIGRPHIARVLVEKYHKRIPTIDSAFEQLLGRGKPAYLERESGFGFIEAIDLIHRAGGLAILAHPFAYPYEPETLASAFKTCRGDGIETYYDYVSNRPEKPITETQNKELETRAKKLAAEVGLLESGGSDFHGKNKMQGLGRFGAPDPVLAELKLALGKSGLGRK